MTFRNIDVPVNDLLQTIYIANIPFDATEESLRKKIETVSEVVKLYWALDGETNHFAGFAFATLQNNKDCLKAIEDLNRKDFNGRPLHVAPPINNDGRPIY